MKSQIVYLSNQLRDKGLGVSIRSTQTALDTYELLGTDDLALLKRALRSVYVKDKYDIAKFDEIFDECFLFPFLLIFKIAYDSLSSVYQFRISIISPF